MTAVIWLLVCAFITCSVPSAFVLYTSKRDSLHAFLMILSYAASIYSLACSYHALAFSVQKQKSAAQSKAPVAAPGFPMRERPTSDAGPSKHKFSFSGIQLLKPNSPALEACAFSVAVVNLVFLALCGFIYSLWPAEFSRTLSYLLSLILSVTCTVIFSERLAPLHKTCQLRWKPPKVAY